MKMALCALVVALVCLSITCSIVNGASSAPFNITKVLEKYPEYAEFNDALTRTKLADDINSRQTITVLALTNSAMGGLEGGRLHDLKKALSVHVVLDYYDSKKLHDISNGSTLTTTLYRTTNHANGELGFINITELKGGKVGFGPAEKGSNLSATFVKNVKQVGYNLSVVELSQPIETSVGEAPAPAPSQLNITTLLTKAGCKKFANLLTTSGVLKTLQENMQSGFTIFAPVDEAFSKATMRVVDKLSDGQLTSLVSYHVRPVYTPMGTLKITNKEFSTMASDGDDTYLLKASTSGNTVTLSTGVNKATVADLLVDDQPDAAFSINNVLMPKELSIVAPLASPPAPPSFEYPAFSPVSPKSQKAKTTSHKNGASTTHVGAAFTALMVFFVAMPFLLIV